jgi:transposase-like protein
MGSTPNQVFYWRKLYEAGQLESTVLQSTGDLGARAVRLLSVSVDEGAERRAPDATAASTADHTAGSDALPRSIELTLARGRCARCYGVCSHGLSGNQPFPETGSQLAEFDTVLCSIPSAEDQ